MFGGFPPTNADVEVIKQGPNNITSVNLLSP